MRRPLTDSIVSGEPGIGKTTLLANVADELSTFGAWRAAFGACFERVAGTEAYSPLLELLEAPGNFGRISDAVEDLREGMRLTEVNHERYWLPRLPNTLGWLHADVFDFKEALRLNREGVAIARELKFSEGEGNSHVNPAAWGAGPRQRASGCRRAGLAGRLLVPVGIPDPAARAICGVLAREGRFAAGRLVRAGIS